MENKDFALFTFTMPNNNSWNGHWSGERDLFNKALRIVSRGKNMYPDLKEGDYYYNFHDGWGANVNVKFVTDKEVKQMTKKSKGFCGYEWMIKSILKNNKILCQD